MDMKMKVVIVLMCALALSVCVVGAVMLLSYAPSDSPSSTDHLSTGHPSSSSTSSGGGSSSSSNHLSTGHSPSSSTAWNETKNYASGVWEIVAGNEYVLMSLGIGVLWVLAKYVKYRLTHINGHYVGRTPDYEEMKDGTMVWRGSYAF